MIALEVGVRAISILDQNYLDQLVHRRGGEDAVGELTLADIIQVSPDDLIAYELRGGTHGVFQGHDLSLNALGFRDNSRSTTKGVHTFRIVGLGDSHMFGWGVERDEAFLAVLERLLAERASGKVFEVWNTAVPGYNTVQEVEAFAQHADLLQPDLVIINYVNNDMDLPNFLAERPNVWTVRKSFLAELVSRRIALLDGRTSLPIGLFGVVPDQRTKRYLYDTSRVAERYRPLAGWDHMEAAFDRLAVLCRERGIRPVLLINMDDYTARSAGKTPDGRPKNVRELAVHCAKEGYLVVDPQDRITAYLKEHDLGPSAVWLAPTDSHTNVLRHRLVAEELLQRLEESGFLPPS